MECAIWIYLECMTTNRAPTVPFLTFSFGVIVMSMASVQSYHGFLAARTFLGLAEAGALCED